MFGHSIIHSKKSAPFGAHSGSLGNSVYACVVVGAGAAGLMFAASLDLKKINSGRVTGGLILEKTGKPGTKLLMSGSGQCNITHAGSIKEFVDAYGPHGKKIRNVLYKHNNDDAVQWLNAHGVPTYEREDGKVFPVSMDAHDVRDAYLDAAAQNGFQLKTDSCLTGLREITDEELLELEINGTQKILTRRLVIATGGCSYPTSGSDGQIFPVLEKDLGLEITELIPSLAPVRVADYPYAEISGIAFPEARVSILEGATGKKIAERTDAVLFTHKDFSGPGVLNLSRYASQGTEIQFSYIGLRKDQATAMLNEAIKGSKAEMTTILARTFDIPKRFAAIVAARAGASTKAAAQILTEDRFKITSTGGFKQAMATAGGVAISQVDLKSMQLKDHPGVYVIGEALDIDGITGGYNLQFCWSSANAAADAMQK